MCLPGVVVLVVGGVFSFGSNFTDCTNLRLEELASSCHDEKKRCATSPCYFLRERELYFIF